MCWGVVEVGKNLTGKYKKGQRFVFNRRWGYQADIQPDTATNILGQCHLYDYSRNRD